MKRSQTPARAKNAKPDPEHQKAAKRAAKGRSVAQAGREKGKKPSDPAKELRKARAAANREKHTGTILMAAKAAGMPVEEREHRFHPERKWRFDFAWPSLKIAIEVNGGGGRGRHNTVVGATNDAEKMNAAQLMGWIVLAYTAKSVRDGVQIANDLIQAQIVRSGR